MKITSAEKFSANVPFYLTMKEKMIFWYACTPLLQESYTSIIVTIVVHFDDIRACLCILGLGIIIFNFYRWDLRGSQKDTENKGGELRSPPLFSDFPYSTVLLP